MFSSALVRVWPTEERDKGAEEKKRLFLKESSHFVICNKFYSPLEGHSIVRGICKQLV